jgi:hypothetical protein
VCVSCGAILAHDNGDADGLCSPCRHAGRRVVPFAGVGADPREVAAALLLLQHNLHPGEPLDLRAALAHYGLEVSTEELCPIVRWLRRRGFELGATPGKPGHELLHWRHQFRRHRHRQLTLFG